MTRPLRWYDYLSVNIYFLGLTTVSQTNIVVIPSGESPTAPSPLAAASIK